MRYKQMYKFDSLTKDDIFLIRHFAGEVGFNTEDNIFDLSSIINKRKRAFDQERNQEFMDRSSIKKMLNNEDLRNMIKLFNNAEDAEFVIKILDKTSNEFSKYNVSDPLSKYDDESKTLYDLILEHRISYKDSHLQPSEAYKEIYMEIFTDAKLSKHVNVSKLKKLINEIFGIALKDKDIKKNKDDWWL